ncbi:MAG TPA: acylphosphatase [Pseudomonas xinjiangensis]|uniref:Acylphosphatase n=2 Tax=root TaxID=1 RepID=A0A7V1FRB9_9GAMM|nr:acylphosphatase [Halopseudomonas xinjiangensis]HEC47982.1 acylphosphatase [Halopseudomonas xinjiangensis]
MSKISLQGVVKGKVQGVGFRQATVRRAVKLGVDGWVRNTDDGAVDVLICGDEAAVEAMAAWLSTGPTQARVDSVAFSSCAWQDIAGFVQL